MEPVFALTSRSAAAQAMEPDFAVRDVPYERLEARLRAEGQVLRWNAGP